MESLYGENLNQFSRVSDYDSVKPQAVAQAPSPCKLGLGYVGRISSPRIPGGGFKNCFLLP